MKDKFDGTNHSQTAVLELLGFHGIHLLRIVWEGTVAVVEVWRVNNIISIMVVRDASATVRYEIGLLIRTC